MPRARNIKPGFFVNDELCELPPLTRLLFVGLWCVADRAGRMLDRPKRIKLEVLPGDDCDVDAMLWELHARKFIVRYEFESQSLIEVCNWAKHQRPHHTEKGSDFVGCDYARVTVKPLPGKELPPLTVKEPSYTGDNPPDTGYLIPDTGYLIPDPLAASVNQRPKNLLSISAEKPAEVDDDLRDVFEHWQKAMDKPRAKLDDKRRKLIRAALKHYAADDLRKAIDGCKGSAWHMGANERGKAFNGLELILRNAEKIDAFMGMHDAPPETLRTLTRDEQRANAIAQLTGRNRPQGGGNDPYTIDV